MAVAEFLVVLIEMLAWVLAIVVPVVLLAAGATFLYRLSAGGGTLPVGWGVLPPVRRRAQVDLLGGVLDDLGAYLGAHHSDVELAGIQHPELLVRWNAVLLARGALVDDFPPGDDRDEARIDADIERARALQREAAACVAQAHGAG